MLPLALSVPFAPLFSILASKTYLLMTLETFWKAKHGTLLAGYLSAEATFL